MPDRCQVPVPRPWGVRSPQGTIPSQKIGEDYALSKWLQEPGNAQPFNNIAFVEDKWPVPSAGAAQSGSSNGYRAPTARPSAAAGTTT
ncbi:hypothetical protein TruAng_004012 [Truncatella angustata]|nr:hypothetical protein TruAng_004012 [Truncatella angustata]